MQQRPRRTPMRLLLAGIKLILLAVVLYFVGRALYERLSKVQFAELRIQPLYLVVGMGMYFLSQLSVAIGYRKLLEGFCPPPPLGQVCAATWIPLLGKYIPGKVLSFAGVMWLLNRMGIPAAVATSLVVLEQGLTVMMAVLLATPAMFWAPLRESMPWAWCGGLVIIAASLVILHPRIFAWLCNLILRKLRRQPLRQFPDLSHYLPCLVAQVFNWGFIGLATCWIALAVTPVSLDQWFWIITGTILSNIIGYLMIFAPAGIGVRDGILLVLLTRMLGGEFGAIVVVLVRLLQTLSEVLLSSAGLVYFRRIKKNLTPAAVPEKPD